jgi:N-acetylmuramoyl-L-alanine amidase
MWKMYEVMKRVAIGACIFLICLASFLSAEKTAQISLRYSRQDAIVRLVIEGEENIIAGSTTIASPAVLRIDFPALFDLKKPQDFPFEILKKDRTLNIMLKDTGDIKVYKLSNPSRIVAEMKVKTADIRQQPGQAAVPPPTPLGQVTAPAAKPQPPLQKPAAPPTAVAPAATPPGAAPQAAAPPPSLPEVAYRTIVIDPGHGGYDFGIIDQQFKEKDFTLNLAKELGGLLAKKGVKVVLTRKVDQSLPITERISLANSKSPDLFLSIHATPADAFAVTTAAMDDPGADTVLRLYKLSLRQSRHIDRSRVIARSIAEAVTADFKPGAVIRELPLPVLASLDAPAMLIEYPVSATDQKEREKLISAIVKGLLP